MNDPAVIEWTVSQNVRTRAHLDAIADRAVVQARLDEMFSETAPSYGGFVCRPGRAFALKMQPPHQQRLLVSLNAAMEVDSEKVVLDPNALEPKGQVAVDWFVPSPDGTLVAVSLSENGSERGTLCFFDTETGRVLPDRIAGVQYPTGGGSAAWAPDGKSIYYTRYPRAGERSAADLCFYQQIHNHRLGTPESDDKYCAGSDFPRIAQIVLQTSRDGHWLLAKVANGDGGEYAHHVLDLSDPGDPEWRQITRFQDAVRNAAFGCDGCLYLRSVENAPRGKILVLPLDGSVPLADAAVIVPEGEGVIECFCLSASGIYLVELIGGPSRIRRFDFSGREFGELPVPADSGISEMVTLIHQGSGDDCILYCQTSFTQPDAWYRYDPSATNGAGEVARTALTGTSHVDFSDIEVVREFAASDDGTQVPINIVRRKGTPLDGKNPTLLRGYGGYGHSMRPQFNVTLRLWFDRGGIYVVANLRGGGEFGEEWHRNGNLTLKQNVFSDFAACARHLIERRYTCSGKLAVEGRSNGGLLMGAFLTQNPQLARVAVAHVGMYDMLRVELDPNGAFNIPEFGTVTDAAQFQALYAYSPYHRVMDGTPYPSVFLLTGEKDGRVNPAHSRKMAARLQEASGSDNPVLLRISSDSGHGMGTSLAERIAETADVFAFLFQQLGLFPPRRPDQPHI